MTHIPPTPPPADGRVPRAEVTARAAALGHELAAAAATDGDEARVLARHLAGSLTPEARLVLLSALAEAGASHGSGRPAVHGSGRPAVRGPGQALADAPGDVPPSGGHGFPRAPRNDAPPGLVRLRFADARALEAAGAAFGARPGTGPGGALSDPATLTLRIPGDTGVETVRAVLAVLDAAAVTAESLTVHSHALDDVFAAVTGLP
ncbi:hypothetical protein [Streptomyces phaeofaciens]|uniref:hypothetical protein n=1 Tax=Streptomyces phaeofaciens TaxID=68254 RepID=UPI0036AAF208